MVRVRLARVVDAEAVGAVFARAFAEDPVTSWVTPDAGRRGRVLKRLNTAIARYEGVPRGATYIAEDAGTIVGAAIWQPPRSPALHRGSLPFALLAGAALGRDIPRMTRMGRAVSGARPREPHWYLQLLGVDPDAQHGGTGSALVRAHLPLVDERHLPAYLETTAENLPFYERLGFHAIGAITIHESAPREYSLVRRGR